MSLLDDAAENHSAQSAERQARAELDSPQNKLIAIMRQNLSIKADKPNVAVVDMPERYGHRESISIRFDQYHIELVPNGYSALPIIINIREKDGGLTLMPTQTTPDWLSGNANYNDRERREAMQFINTAATRALLGDGGKSWQDGKGSGRPDAGAH